MKRFTIPCQFGETKAPFHVYVGQPAPGCHPLKYQTAWLREERGGVVPPEVLDSLARLLALAIENGVSFEDLCVYALGLAANDQEEGRGSGGET
jgi:hypothetical protein